MHALEYSMDMVVPVSDLIPKDRLCVLFVNWRLFRCTSVTITNALGSRDFSVATSLESTTVLADIRHTATYSIFTRENTNASRVLTIVWASICPSVTLRYCIKPTQARITKFSPYVAAKIWFIVRKFCLLRWGGSPRTATWNRGTP